MRAIFFFIFYIFLITMIAACGTVDEPNPPIDTVPSDTEPVKHSEVTPFGHITYYPLGEVNVCD
jgi:hypothetical protein